MCLYSVCVQCAPVCGVCVCVYSVCVGLVYFWNFPFNIFELRVTKASESEAMDKEAEGRLCLLLSLRCCACWGSS